MQNAKGRCTPAQPADRDDIHQTVVADLAFLIERIQASLMMIVSAVATEASAVLQEMTTNIVVLDDVTPRYLKAGAALKACDAGLGVAQHFLREPMASGSGMFDPAGNPHLPAHGSNRIPHSPVN